MTSSSGRSATESRRSGRSTAQWLLGLFIVLALVASILMVFTDSLSITGSLAVIAALWAAVIGAILVTKFRRQAETAEAKSRDLRLVYELQLEREIAARRQYELDIETTIRKEVTAESTTELIELQNQVASLRASLEILLGEPLPDERVALPNEKLRELASGLERGTALADDGALAARDFAATAPEPGIHEPAPVDPNELTEVIPIVTDDPVSGRIAAVYEQSVYEQAEYDQAAYAPAYDTPAYETPGFETPVADVAEDEIPESFVPEFDAAETPVAPEPVVDEVPDAPVDDTVAVATERVVDEPKTDEWPAIDADAIAAADAADRAAAADSAETVETVDAVVVEEPSAASDEEVDSEDDDAEDDAPGRHEGEDGSSPFGGRRRRRDDDSDDNAHTSGLPVSELLSQLREAGAPSGRRRRAD